jgi:branched-chain amino acid transport system substrate-binding protein
MNQTSNTIIISKTLTRTTLLRLLLPGIAISALGFAGCKDPNAGTAPSGTTTTSSSTAAKQDLTVETINVGEYSSMTGETSTFGVESSAGVQFAADELNAAGGIDVGGKKMMVKIENQDDQSKPDEAKTIVIKYASDPKIVAVIGEVASSRSKVAAPELQRAGIPMISPSSTNPDVTKVGDFIFRVCFIDPFQGYVMAKFASEELKAKKIAIMRDPSQDYSVGLADVFKEEFTKMGGTITNDVSYKAADSDFRSQLGQIKTAGAEAIFIPGYYNEVGTIARQAKELGITAPLLGGDGWDSEKLVEGAGGPGGALEGSYFSSHYSKDAEDEKVKTFVKAYTAKNSKAPASLVAQGYDAMMILADAIKRAGSIERGKVRDALAQTKDYAAVTGKITIDENRNANKSAVILQIKGKEFAYAKTVAPK